MTSRQFKIIRASLGVTQFHLGKFLGLSTSTIANYERDRVRIPRMIKALMLGLYQEQYSGTTPRIYDLLYSDERQISDILRITNK